MKEYLRGLVNKAIENKETLIRVGLVIAGAAGGALITAAIINAQTNSVEIIVEPPQTVQTN